MNREIKFRIWDGEWMLRDKDSPACLDDFADGYIHNTRLEDCDVMQYTGMTDKNGEDIYEGDILERYYEEPYDPNIALVVFDRGQFTTNPGLFYPESERSELQCCEIIGNIFETDVPEIKKGWINESL